MQPRPELQTTARCTETTEILLFPDSDVTDHSMYSILSTKDLCKLEAEF